MSEDITYCKGDDCPIKKLCKRYADSPLKKAYYYLSPPPFSINEGAVSCEMYWGVREEEAWQEIRRIINIVESQHK